MTSRRKFLTACAAATALRGAGDAPVIRFGFDQDWNNKATWGGVLRPEGKAVLDGGTADLSGGGRVVYEDRRLAELGSFSALVSFYPRTLSGNGILLSRRNQWQIRLGANGVLSVTTYYSPSNAQTSDLTQISETGTWYQMAISFDRAQLRLYTIFRQPGAADSLSAESFKMVKPSPGAPVSKDSPLEAGPFSGSLDDLTLFDRALSPAELRQALEASTPSPVHSGLPSFSKLILPLERDAATQLPSRADVPMSSRWWHPQKPGDPHDTMLDLAAFGATRLEWIYDTDPAHIRRVTDAGLSFCATINASDNSAGRPFSGCDFDGHLAVFSWMVSWIQKDGQPTGAACVNNQRFRERNAETIRQVVAAGAAGVQFDDWASNLSFASGECFCAFCLKRFPEYLHANYSAQELTEWGAAKVPFDYRDYLKSVKSVSDLPQYLKYRKQNASDPLQRAYVRFQSASVRDNLTALKVALASNRRAGGKRPTLSVNANFNSTSQQSKSFTGADIPDYFIGEGGDETLAGMFLNAKIAEFLQRPGIFSPFPYHVDKTRSEIALQYALGQLCLTPYDVWMHASDVPRHFGNPADYRDLFGFIRENRQLLESCESVATVALAVDTARAEDVRVRPLVQTLAENNVPFSIVLTGKDKFEPRVSAMWRQNIRHIVNLSGQETIAELLPDAHVREGEFDSSFLRELAPLRIEPPNVIATIRGTPDGKTIAIHLVNRNFDEFSRAAELDTFGVTLVRSEFWGGLSRVEWLTPGAKVQILPCKAFGRDRRVTVPGLKTWAILRIA